MNDFQILQQYDGLWLLENKIHTDNRGSFQRLFSSEIYNIGKFKDHSPQISMASNLKKHTLRGMHFQKKPFDETKIVKVINGSILDIVININENSRDYGKIFKFNLTAKENTILIIGSFYAHGYITLEDKTDLIYSIDTEYSPKYQSGINPFDQYLDIDWGVQVNACIISEKDKKLPNFNEIEL